MKYRNLDILFDYGRVDHSVIESFEIEFNCKLPRSYVDLIENHNGVCFKQSYFDYQDNLKEGDSISSVGFDGFKTETNDIISDIRSQFINSDPVYGYDNVISFGSNGAGDYICFFMKPLYLSPV